MDVEAKDKSRTKHLNIKCYVITINLWEKSKLMAKTAKANYLNSKIQNSNVGILISDNILVFLQNITSLS